MSIILFLYLLLALLYSFKLGKSLAAGINPQWRADDATISRDRPLALPNGSISLFKERVSNVRGLIDTPIYALPKLHSALIA